MGDQILKRNRFLWSWLILACLPLAAQCALTGAPSTPPLPTTPTGPVLDIAVLSPSTGEMATFGRSMRNGLIMAFDHWNEQDGLLGHRLTWQVYDSGCDFETARHAAQQAVAAGHQFIIGPLCSEAAIAAATVAEANQVLMITPTATHPLVTVDGRGQIRTTVFRASYAYPWQGQIMARFAAGDLSAKKAALLYNPRDDYATALTEAFAREFPARGGDVVYQAAYAPDDGNFAVTLADIPRSGASIVYLPAPAAVANQIAAELTTLNTTSTSPAIILLGSDRWQSSELDTNLTAGSYYPVHFSAKDQRPQVQTWIEAYKAAYAVAPDTLAVLGYDAVNLLAQAIRQAGTFDATAVAELLEQGTFDGVTGPITFDGQHNPMKPAPVMRVEQGGIEFEGVIGP